MRREFMCYGYCKGLPFREFFPNKEMAKDYCEKFRKWHGTEDFCKVAECQVTDLEV